MPASTARSRASAPAPTAGSTPTSPSMSATARRIAAWREINMYAGLAGDGTVFSSVQATATTVVNNNTAIPISTLVSRHGQCRRHHEPDARPHLEHARRADIYLGATQGRCTAAGNGSNYNPYLGHLQRQEQRQPQPHQRNRRCRAQWVGGGGRQQRCDGHDRARCDRADTEHDQSLFPSGERLPSVLELRPRRQSLQPGDELEPPDGPVCRRRQLQSLPAGGQPARDR